MKIKKLTKEDLIVTSVKCFFIALVAWVITSCATHYTSGYKFETPKGNFYTNYFVIKHDSIFMIEINRNDSIRRGGAFKLSEVRIIRNMAN